MAGGGASAPSSEPPGPGEEHEELLKVLDAIDAEKSQQKVALEVFEEGGTEPWDTDGGPRSKARRRIDKAKALRDGGYGAAFLEPRRKRRRRHTPDPGSEPGVLPPGPA